MPDWPQAGTKVWVVGHIHTWDAYLNNHYFPAQRKVRSLGTDTVHLVDDVDKKITDCYTTREYCVAACPADHADP